MEEPGPAADAGLGKPPCFEKARHNPARRAEPASSNSDKSPDWMVDVWMVRSGRKLRDN